MKRRIVISDDDDDDEPPNPPVAKKRAADQPAAASTTRPTPTPAAVRDEDGLCATARREREQALEHTLAVSGLLGTHAEKPRRERPSAPASRAEAGLQPADTREAAARPPAASTARPKAPVAPVSADELERSALTVVQEVSTRFPEHAALLRRIAIETSSRMQSSGAKTVFDGAPPHRPRCVRLSVPILSVRKNFGSLRDIMLHELAHCIAGRDAAHGPRWRKVCLALGGTAAIGHTLSCGGGSDGDGGRRPAQQEQPRRRSASASRGRGSGSSSSSSGRSREPSDMWGAASDALISQLIRF